MKAALVLLGALAAAVGVEGFVPPAPRGAAVGASSSTRCMAHASEQPQQSRADVLKGASAALLGGLALGLGQPLQPARAAEDEGQVYEDSKYNVQFKYVPKEWPRTDTKVGTDELDFRKLVVYKDPASPANVFIAYTPVQPDFATLGSFGSILDVSKTIVPTGRGITSKLLKATSKNGYYIFDYTLQPDRQPERHLVTIFALVPGEALVTYTANCLSSQYEELGPVFSKITDSFKIGSN